MLEMSRVSFGYGLKRNFLKDFSLLLPDGGRICLQGASGAGKTTVLRLAMGLERPRRGSVTLSPGTRISAVFQEDRLLSHKTALENVALFGEEKTARETLCKLLPEEHLTALPAALSGGQKRRVALARALNHPFDLLILDEALTGLDEESRSVCLAAIDEAVGDRCLLMVSHDLRDAQVLRAEIRGLHDADFKEIGN